MMRTSTLIKLVPAGNGIDVICSIRNTSGPQFSNNDHFVSRVTFSVNGDTVTEFDTGPGFSDNPVVGIHLSTLEQGDRIGVQWIDSSGNRGQAQATAGKADNVVTSQS
jgi:hypothetical protein